MRRNGNGADHAAPLARGLEGAVRSGGRGLAADRRLLPGSHAKCGAVDRGGSLAPDPGRGAQEVPPRARAGPSTLAAAASGRASVLKSTPKSTARTAPRGRSRPLTAEFRITPGSPQCSRRYRAFLLRSGQYRFVRRACAFHAVSRIAGSRADTGRGLRSVRGCARWRRHIAYSTMPLIGLVCLAPCRGGSCGSRPGLAAVHRQRWPARSARRGRPDDP